MEVKLQYDCYHSRFAKHFWQFCMDQMVYGFGALRADWQEKKAYRSQKINNSFQGMFQQVLNSSAVAPMTRELKTIFEGNEIKLPHNKEGFKLITRIQNEVHRFAIEYHRKLREKIMVRSILDDIKNIGDKRKKALLKNLSSALHQKGLLITFVPVSAAFFKYAR